jgi:integrase
MPRPRKPAPKRGNGLGSITHRADGRIVVRVTLPDGGRISRYAKTQTEAEKLLRTLLVERDRGQLVAAPNQTLADYLAAWLRDVVTPTVRESTAARYGQIVRHHLAPSLGRHRLDRLTAPVVAAHYRKLGESLSPAMVGAVHQVLHRALEHAVRWELVPRNVCDLVDPPRAVSPEMRALSPVEARRLLEAATGDPLEALYVLALTTGMRQGELLGLRWADLDLDSGVLDVRRTLSRVQGAGFVESAPKTAKGRRTIALTPLAVDALGRHRVAQAEARLLAGDSWADRDLVFCTRGGTPIEAQNLRARSFAPLLSAAGLPAIRFHDLRHSAASLLLELGTHPKIVQELLGHANVNITLNTYSHARPTLQVDAVNRLGDLLGG